MFKNISIEELKINPWTLIGSEWMLVTAGSRESYNMLTASWGGFGHLWNKNVCFTFIRPNRHTFNFTEAAEYCTLSFFPREKRSILEICGTKSGRDFNKMEIPGLTPVFETPGAVYFNEAKLVLITKKIYYQDISPDNFIDPDLIKNYPQHDFHRLYIGEIILIKSLVNPYQ